MIIINDAVIFLKNNYSYIFEESDNMILILPKNFFIEFLIKKGVTDKTVEEKTKVAFISINDSVGSEPYFKKAHPNALTLFFEDIVEPIESMENFKLFSDEQAIKLVNFIEKNKDKSFIIHCEAGISRSGAVGQFINDTYKNMTDEEFKKQNKYISPNQYMYHKLIKAYKNEI